MANQLLGPIPAWGSLTLVGSAGFLLGAVLAGLVARCLSGRASAASVAPHRAFVAAEAGEQGSPAAEWGKGGGPGAANAVRASGVSGPLGVGAVVNNSGGYSRSGAAAPAAAWPAAARVAGGAPGAPHPALQISSPSDANPRSSSCSGAASHSGGAAASSGATGAAATAAVRDAYELEELDDEWRALVQEVDDRLVAARAPKCGAAERASVVQALLASAPDESAEDALDRAARLVRAARRGGAAVASGFA
jgi:hypothetical protein